MPGVGTRFRTRILRKQATLPRYVAVKPEHVMGRTLLWIRGSIVRVPEKRTGVTPAAQLWKRGCCKLVL
jgi:hypothetical protein